MINKIDNEFWRSRDNSTKVAMIKEKVNEIIDFINSKMLAIIDKPEDVLVNKPDEDVLIEINESVVVEEVKAESVEEEQPKKKGRR